MGATTEQPAAATAPESKDPLLKFFRDEPHRASTAEDVVRAFTPAVAKDPQKLPAAVQDVTGKLQKLLEAGHITEIGDGLYKARLFFDKERYIEHAFIGGMGNTLYRFHCPLFRLNIGVLSLFFLRDQKARNWAVTVRDTTIGKDYSFARRLRDGVYTFGSQKPENDGEHYLRVEGKYIAKRHVVLTLAGEDIAVEDLKTLNGTRIDHLTKEGLARFREVAREFLEQADPRSHREPVVRGRFILDKLLHDHQNYESGFFSAVVDSLLLEKLSAS
jgi:hypothetical protein